MKTIIIFILVVLLNTSCNPDENDMTIIDTSIGLSVINEEGADLLDPENSNSIKESDIKIFYLNNYKMEEFYEGHLEYSKGFRIFKHKDEYRIIIFPNDIVEEYPYPITYIKWNEDDMDTIKCEIEKKSNSTICTKVWFNDELKWKSTDQTERFFTIVK